MEHIDAVFFAPQGTDAVRVRATLPLSGARKRLRATLYAELLDRGTKHKTRTEFAAALDSIGARLAVSADRFGITIDGAALSATLPQFLSLVSEMLREPAFSSREMSRVHRQYLQALHDEADDARTVAYGAFARLVYPTTHPCWKPTVAERRDFLKSVTQKTYRDFHKDLLAGRAVVSVSGTARAQNAALALFSSLTKGGKDETVGNKPPSSFANASKDGGLSAFTPVPSKTNIETFLGAPLALTLTDEQCLPFQFGLAVLGKWGGFSGRLMSQVREKMGLTYGIYARAEGAEKTRTGAWYIFTFFTPKDFANGLAATKREIEKIVRAGITHKELIRFKELLHNQFILAHESDQKKLALYHDALCAGLTPAEVAAEYEKIRLLTQKQINAALKAHLNPHTLALSAAGPITPNGKPIE